MINIIKKPELSGCSVSMCDPEGIRTPTASVKGW
jgi:hypothetical protein